MLNGWGIAINLDSMMANASTPISKIIFVFFMYLTFTPSATEVLIPIYT